LAAVRADERRSLWCCADVVACAQSEVQLPSPLSPDEARVLAVMKAQLAEGLVKEAAATFLAEREVHPESILCSGCV
jgi:hypothetical protein